MRTVYVWLFLLYLNVLCVHYSNEYNSTDVFQYMCDTNKHTQYKMLGEQELALDKFTQALHVYMDTTGKQHVSYASALTNIGALYKEMSKGITGTTSTTTSIATATAGTTASMTMRPVKGMEKLQLLERAEEALVEARNTYIALGDQYMDFGANIYRNTLQLHSCLNCHNFKFNAHIKRILMFLYRRGNLHRSTEFHSAFG